LRRRWTGARGHSASCLRRRNNPSSRTVPRRNRTYAASPGLSCASRRPGVGRTGGFGERNRPGILNVAIRSGPRPTLRRFAAEGNRFNVSSPAHEPDGVVWNAAGQRFETRGPLKAAVCRKLSGGGRGTALRARAAAGSLRRFQAGPSQMTLVSPAFRKNCAKEFPSFHGPPEKKPSWGGQETYKITKRDELASRPKMPVNPGGPVDDPSKKKACPGSEGSRGSSGTFPAQLQEAGPGRSRPVGRQPPARQALVAVRLRALAAESAWRQSRRDAQAPLLLGPWKHKNGSARGNLRKARRGWGGWPTFCGGWRLRMATPFEPHYPAVPLGISVWDASPIIYARVTKACRTFFIFPTRLIFGSPWHGWQPYCVALLGLFLLAAAPSAPAQEQLAIKGAGPQSLGPLSAAARTADPPAGRPCPSSRERQIGGRRQGSDPFPQRLPPTTPPASPHETRPRRQRWLMPRFHQVPTACAAA